MEDVITSNAPKILRALANLRKAGIEAIDRIQEAKYADSDTKLKKGQFIALALVSDREIQSEPEVMSLIQRFTTYMRDDRHYTRNGEGRLPKYVNAKFLESDRVAVVMNGISKFSYVHGECRVFDPTRELLTYIIGNSDRVYNRSTHGCYSPIQRKDSARFILDNIEEQYITKHHWPLNTSILLMYSYYIPCDSNECSMILREFVQNTQHTIVVGYEEVYGETDVDLALENLNCQNIFLFKPTILKNEIYRNEEYNEISDSEYIARNCGGTTLETLEDLRDCGFNFKHRHVVKYRLKDMRKFKKTFLNWDYLN